jgi:hypothetical protein
LRRAAVEYALPRSKFIALTIVDLFAADAGAATRDDELPIDRRTLEE